MRKPQFLSSGLLVLLTCLLLFALPTAGRPAAPQEGAKTFVAEYSGDPDAAINAVANAGGTIVAHHSQINLIIVESTDPNFATALSAYANLSYVVEDQDVEWLPNEQADTTNLQGLSATEPSASSSPFGASFLSLQWNIFVTKTNQAWSITQGSSQVKVAVLDTGICSHHIDTIGKVDFAQSASFVTELSVCAPAVSPPCIGCPSWEDRNFHGTHVAGIISTNNFGIAGIAPNVRLRAVKVLRCNGSGPFSAVINGIMFAATTGNDVINMSLGAYFPKNGGPGPGSLGRLVAALNKAVNFAESQGVLVASAAGNSAVNLDKDKNFIEVPCQSGSGMCVASTTRSDALSSFSNHGLSGPQIAAPGGGSPVAPFPATTANLFILSVCSRHSVLIPVCGTSSTQFWLFAAGTSMATPHISGAAALVDSISRAGPGSRRGSQLRNALLQGADDLGKPGADNIYSHGRLNTLGALQ